MTDSVVASSAAERPGPTLRGYALVGADLVIGAEGQNSYGSVPAGGDGAYASIQENGSGGLVIGTDVSGYGRVYLYRSDDNWAVGTSLMELADYAYEKGWQLTVDRVQVQSFLLGSRKRKPHLITPGMITQQIVSRETVFREVTLLLPEEEVHVEGAGTPRATVVKRAERQSSEDYADVLQAGLREMVARLRTMLESDLVIRSDITGGRDSRAILAGLVAANPSDRHIGDIAYFRSGVHVESDWKIVEPLSRKYGLEVNRPTPAPPARVDAETGYTAWRRNDLGVYAPLYPVTSYFGGISLTGAAGGVHRRVYADQTLERNILARKTDSVSSDDIAELARRAKRTVDEADYDIDDNLAHFRLFRNRFHGGRGALRSLSVAPLSSKLLQHASNLLSAEHLDRAQFFADVMLNLHPELAAEPYDSPSKGWDDLHRDELTRVSVGDPEPGQVHGSVSSAFPGSGSSGRRALDPYCDEFDRLAGRVISSGVLPAEYVYSAGLELHSSREPGLSHAINGAPISTVLLVGQALEMERSRSSKSRRTKK